MGTKYCHKCETHKPTSEFRKSNRFKDGLQTQCKTCMDNASRDWRIRNRKQHSDRKQHRTTSHTKKFREWKRTKGCVICSETEPCCLDLHHLDPTQKHKNLSNLMQASWNRIMEETQKCVVLCRNCHARVHEGIIEIDDFRV